jgi:hypothetical protein
MMYNFIDEQQFKGHNETMAWTFWNNYLSHDCIVHQPNQPLDHRTSKMTVTTTPTTTTSTSHEHTSMMMMMMMTSQLVATAYVMAKKSSSFVDVFPYDYHMESKQRRSLTIADRVGKKKLRHYDDGPNELPKVAQEKKKKSYPSVLQFGILLTDINTVDTYKREKKGIPTTLTMLSAGATVTVDDNSENATTKSKSNDEIILNRLYDTLVDGVRVASSITLQHVAVDWSTYHTDGICSHLVGLSSNQCQYNQISRPLFGGKRIQMDRCR